MYIYIYKQTYSMNTYFLTITFTFTYTFIFTKIIVKSRLKFLQTYLVQLHGLSMNNSV